MPRQIRIWSSGVWSLPLSAVVVATLLIAFPAFASAQRDEIRTQRLSFPPGSSSITVNGTIRGSQVVDYVVLLRPGQPLNVSMASRNRANYFNLLAPGEREVAFHVGSTSGNQYEGMTGKGGDYRIRVYLMRAAARRNEVANFRLEIIAGSPGTPSNLPGDALVPGTGFHATGEVPCALHFGQPSMPCKFGVRRTGRGNGRVEITRVDGRKRIIIFRNGRATGYERGPAERDELRVTREADLNFIRIGRGERYEIPDAVILGG